MVATQLNNNMANSEIEQLAVVSLDKYVCNIIQGRKNYFHHAVPSNTATMQKFLGLNQEKVLQTQQRCAISLLLTAGVVKV